VSNSLLPTQADEEFEPILDKNYRMTRIMEIMRIVEWCEKGLCAHEVCGADESSDRGTLVDVFDCGSVLTSLEEVSMSFTRLSTSDPPSTVSAWR